MKKLYTLLAAMLMAVTVSAQTTETVLVQNYEPAGQKFYVNENGISSSAVLQSIDWNTDTLHMVFTLLTNPAGEDLISVGPSISTWRGGAVHFYYNQGYLQVDCNGRVGSFNAANISQGNKVTIDISKSKGIFINGQKFDGPNHSANFSTVFASNTIQIGSAEGTASNQKVDTISIISPKTYTVTWQYKANGSDEVLGTYNEKIGEGLTAAYENGPQFTYATINSCDTVVEVTKDTVSTVHVTLLPLPFVPSTDESTATWYYYGNVHNRYLYYNNNDDNNLRFAANDVTPNGDQYMWAFVGNAIKGFKIINKAAGWQKDLYIASPADQSAVVLSNEEMYWTIAKGAANQIKGLSFNFQVNNLYLNNLSGAGQLKLWHQNPNEDAGSNFSAYLADFSTYDVTLHKSGNATYATAYLPKAVTVSEGTKAYKVSNVAADNVTLDELTGTIPANTPMILIGTENTTATLTASTEAATEVGENKLSGIDKPKAMGNADYYLGQVDGTPGLYKASGDAETTFVTGKAYLAASQLTSNAKGFAFTIDDSTTGISKIENDAAANVNAPRYNLAGQRVSKSYKGVVIVGGKKLLQK